MPVMKVVDKRRNTKKRTGNLTRLQVKKIVDAIENALQKEDIPFYIYSLGKYMDECVCLEYESGKWIVYHGHRGYKIREKIFDSAYEAGLCLFSSVAINDEQLRAMRISLRRDLRELL